MKRIPSEAPNITSEVGLAEERCQRHGVTSTTTVELQEVLPGARWTCKHLEDLTNKNEGVNMGSASTNRWFNNDLMWLNIMSSYDLNIIWAGCFYKFWV